MEKVTTQLTPHTATKYYHILSMLYITLVIASVILAHRLSDYFGFLEPGGIFIFPISYFLGDIMAEVYGYKLSRQLIWSTIICVSIFSVLVTLVTNSPYPPIFHNAEAYKTVFGSSILLFLGLICGLFASDFTNIYALTKFKILLKGKHFIIRSIVSTAVCELVFNIVTYSFTYLGFVSFHYFIVLIINSWLFKVAYSLIAVIPSALLVGFLKKHENMDVYDYKTNFNPFKFSLSDK
jgi:uncharacterized integral membrane protein (TIGR00697 family)